VVLAVMHVLPFGKKHDEGHAADAEATAATEPAAEPTDEPNEGPRA